MTRKEVKHFHDEMARKMSGNFTPRERELYHRAKETYDTYMKANGGKNPFFGL